MCLLVIGEILGLFINRLTADDMHFLCNSENLQEPIQVQLSQSKKLFSEFFEGFLKFTFNFKYFLKKMSLIVYVFLKLQTGKDVVRQMSKKPLSESSLRAKMLKGPKCL